MKNETKAVLASTLVAGGGLFLAPLAQSAPKAKHFEFKTHRVTVQKVGHGASTRVEKKADGRVRLEESTTVRIRGRGAHKMTAVVEDEPIAAGGKQKTTIRDISTGTTTIFSYAPAANSITISDGTNRVVVVQNPDHSYSVDGRPAPNGKAAVALLKSKPAYRSASPHAIMLAYTYAHAPNAAARNTQNCDLPSCCEGNGQAATPPAVCTIFRDFCECVACDKTGHGETCKTCQ